MTSINLTAHPLTKQTFAPYGDVVELDDGFHFSMNDETIERYHNLADLDIGDDLLAKQIVSVAVCQQSVSLPYRIELVEHHPLGTQLFYPLFSSPMLVVVCDGVSTPDPQTLKAYITNGKQGVNFHRHVWHMPLIGLQNDQQFIIVDREGPGNNCEKYFFDDNQIITLERIDNA